MTTLSHRTGGARHRRKGARIEHEIVERHKELGIHAERYPLSGASQFRGSGHDFDLYLFGRDEAPAVAEVRGALRRSKDGLPTTIACFFGASMSRETKFKIPNVRRS
jgi:hypothetical protein